MNYQCIHDKIIKKAQERDKPNCYCEKHHIIPKCMNGGNNSSNLVLLTAKEHLLIHCLLVKIYPENSGLIYALGAMCMIGPKTGRKKLNIRTYKYVRELLSRLKKEAAKNLSIEERKEIGRKLSLSRKGINTNYKRRFKIDQYDLNGNLLNSFVSLSEACKLTGHTYKYIRKYIKSTGIKNEFIWIINHNF